MTCHEPRPRPITWHERMKCPRWIKPFHAVEWFFDWAAWYLSNWAFLEVLQYIGSFSVLIAVIFYFTESGDRRKQRHYQAWQVINTAQGKGGSGGRIEALQELNADGVPLVGVNAGGAFLQGVQLHGANLRRCDLEAADLRNADFSQTNLADAGLKWANFRGASLRGANLNSADLEDADFTGADLSNSDLSGVNFDDADLRNAELKDVRWSKIASIKGANVGEVRDAPPGFVDWAKAHGAQATPLDEP